MVKFAGASPARPSNKSFSTSSQVNCGTVDKSTCAFVKHKVCLCKLGAPSVRDRLAEKSL